MYHVHYVFGRRQVQDFPPEYSSGAYDPFVFTITVEDRPDTWERAYAILGAFRDQFIKACIAAETSTWLYSLINREIWIPTCYLDCPTIEVDDEELLLRGEEPNPWLSRVTRVAA